MDADEKKPPVGGVVVLESWVAHMRSDGSVHLERLGPAGDVIETYRSTSRERAALDLVAVMQGCEPLRAPPKALEPIGPGGY